MSPKIVELEELSDRCEKLRSAGKKIVATNGCFDLLHVGHVRYLQAARALGDLLVVGLNGDRSVHELKGAGRPITTQRDRAEILAALQCVDLVTIFPEIRATKFLAAVRPAVYVKGGDYTPGTLDQEERAILKEIGSAIRLIPFEIGYSTSGLIEQICTEQEWANPMTQMKRLPIGILGSGKGSNCRAILERIRSGDLAAEARLVVSDVLDAPILDMAREFRVANTYLPPGRFRTRLEPEIEEQLVQTLRHAGVELVVLAGFMRVLHEPMLKAFPRRIINIHPSLLPKFPGLEAWKQALVAGETVTGCTVHYVDDRIDHGQILAQKEVRILPNDSAESLHARIQVLEHELYPAVIAEFCKRYAEASQQAEGWPDK